VYSSHTIGTARSKSEKKRIPVGKPKKSKKTRKKVKGIESSKYFQEEINRDSVSSGERKWIRLTKLSPEKEKENQRG
jgi:hypothetical protein